MGLARSLPLEVNLAKIQNMCYGLLQTAYPDFQKKGLAGVQDASSWIEHFRALAEKLSLYVAPADTVPAASIASRDKPRGCAPLGADEGGKGARISGLEFGSQEANRVYPQVLT